METKDIEKREHSPVCSRCEKELRMTNYKDLQKEVVITFYCDTCKISTDIRRYKVDSKEGK